MRLRALILPLALPISVTAALTTAASAQSPFTLQQVLSAPFSTDLTAAPTPKSGQALFAWVEHTEGRNNLWIAGPNTPARQLTHNTADDAQDITDLAWSPDASAIAFTYGAEIGADGHPANPAHLQHPTPIQVILQPLAPNAPPINLGEGHSPFFTPDNQHLLFIRSGQIWIEDFTGATAAHQLVLDRGSATSLTLSPDGHTLAYISVRHEANQPSHRFLALFDIPSRTLTFPAPSTGNDSAPAFSPDGQHLAWLRAPFTQAPEFAPDRTSPTPWSIQLLDLTSHATHTIYSPEPNKPGSVLPHMATGQPHLFYTASDRIVFPSEADGWVHLYSLNPSSAKLPYLLTPGDFEVEDPTFDPSSSTLYFSVNFAGYDPLDRDRRHIMSYLLPRSAEDPVEELGMAQVTSGAGIETRPTASDGELAALVSDASTPMHPAFIDPPLGAARAKITPLHPEATPATYPAASLVTPTQVLFTSSDGIPLHAQLFLPSNLDPTKKHPAVLFFHGGPRRQMLLGYPAMGYYSNAYAMNQYLTSLGFIVLSTNYRCGIGYGLDFRQCLHAGADGATEYNDVLAAQKYLASRPDVDVSRIGIWGGSYGGYLTALALARNSNLFAAGVDFHGVHDWNLEDNASDWLLGSYAQKDATAARALASSPLADISHWTSPILFIHGDNDGNVAYAQTPILADALRARNSSLPANSQVDIQELIFPDELHEFALHSTWLAAYQAAAAFFTRTLKPNN
jgi:dipeptidyl aminopeptidase/acylaminoacyl peptidase